MPASEQSGKDPKVVNLERELGITFPGGSRVLGQGDGGSRGGEYYEWLIASPSNVALDPTLGTEFRDRDMATVRLIEHRLSTAYRVPVQARLAGTPARATFSHCDIGPYEYQVDKLMLTTGECYLLVMRHKR